MTWLWIPLGILLLFLILRGIQLLRIRRNRRIYSDYEIKEFPNFLTEVECQHLIDVARPRVVHSDVGVGKRARLWTRRTSATAFLEHSGDRTIQRIKNKIAALTGKPLKRQEKIQVTYYQKLEFYAPHFDASGLRSLGNRDCTVIVYLNDEYRGGCTYFPNLGRRISPEKGKAVFFRNLGTDGKTPHPMSLHQGLWVRSGEKWLCNQWIQRRKL